MTRMRSDMKVAAHDLAGTGRVKSGSLAGAAASASGPSVEGLHRRRGGWVFPARLGLEDHVHPSTVWTWTKTIALDAGVEPARVHTHLLRHTMLTEANDASGDLRTVQAIARHSRPETTAGYTRVDRAKMQAVVAQVNYGRNPGTRGDPASPDPAGTVPGVSYRVLVEALEAEDAPAWLALGVALAAAGWRYRFEHDGLGPILAWSHPERPDLVAAADVAERGPTPTYTYSLDRLDGDESDHWDFTSPAELVAAAAALAAGVDIGGARRFGPWIERPFIEFLSGARPSVAEYVATGPVRLEPST